MLRLTGYDGTFAVLRLMTRQPWRRHAPGLLGREAAVQRELTTTGVPAPTSIAVDPDGRSAGLPAHLMSWLPGTVELGRADDRLLRRLAELAAAIHRIVPTGARPRDYQSWAGPTKWVVPDWARRPDLWRRAFALLDRDPPGYRGTFLHRDLHLGNVLWQDGRVTGVVDWVETSWGPAELDIAHAGTYLAMLHGPAAADRFIALHREHTGTADEPDRGRYWHVMDIVGQLPDPTKITQPWRDLGRPVSDELARTRLEQRLAAVLGEDQI